MKLNLVMFGWLGLFENLLHSVLSVQVDFSRLKWESLISSRLLRLCFWVWLLSLCSSKSSLSEGSLSSDWMMNLSGSFVKRFGDLIIDSWCFEDSRMTSWCSDVLILGSWGPEDSVMSSIYIIWDSLAWALVTFFSFWAAFFCWIFKAGRVFSLISWAHCRHFSSVWSREYQEL